ncbi:MAG: NAD(P)/FAD-dependent oxidoreductase [Dysgonamonadaceae bacterium]|jgi:protoporphyrinogen oxidase|nr:NAD(P)/FAD-dependent oxidoreductase [Dysgonamonadaceae bacterium]
MNTSNTTLNTVIVGAGPAGLTAAYELLKQTTNHPVVFEATDKIGGISQTVQYNGNRMDIGGHRFFSKSQEIMDWWNRMMPIQGKPAFDDILLENKDKPYVINGPDPEKEDRVILYRQRVSRIFFLRKFFDYPISLKMETFTNMGLWRTLKSGFAYIFSQIYKKPNDTLENFYINHFGKTLYQLFFEDYTEKVWGVHPSKLGADWGSQRVKGVSISAVVKDMLVKKFSSKKDNKKVETSLIEQFIYPKFGPGQLWEIVADEVQKDGGEIHLQSEVKKIQISGNKVVSVEYEKDGKSVRFPCDHLFSTMPVKDLIAAIEGIDVPTDVKRIAAELPYRDFITVGLLVKKMKISNKTKIKTYNERVPDTWIYVQERDVKVGRLQIFNNWSPYMVKDYQNTMWIGLEYFCTEGDELWTMDNESFIKMAIDELVKIDVIDKEDVLDAVRIKIKKAYPSYFGAYYELDKVKSFLNTIENLYCLGRNGQHRYNNMDHSMLTAMEAVRNVKENKTNKDNIWAVNTEEEYHEKK